MPSTVTGGDVCEYRNRSMFMAKVLFNRENSKDKNRRRCFQGYQGDIRCPTGESSRTIVLHLVCQQNISMIFDYVRVLFYADDLKLFLPIKNFQDCTKIQSDLNKLSE
jgi:hypothetical protein